MKIFNSYLAFMDDEGHKGQESTLSFGYINALRIQNSDSLHLYKRAHLKKAFENCLGN